ncbi:hypothetical protein MMC30_002690 [Trapelia coarctata]|nr:hypothetical protein [Trapelia coarctata]
MDRPPAPSSYQLRIPPTAFTAFITTFLTLAILSALSRIFLRLRYTRSLLLDDYFLLYAVLSLVAAGALTYGIKDLVYLQIYVGLGWTPPDADLIPRMLVFEKRVQAASALAWSSLYAVKFSFLFFFRTLVRRVRGLKVLWGVVMGCVVVGAMASVPLAFIICANFSDEYMQYCSISSQLANERIYLATTTALDIATDLLIISIPIALLYPMQLPLAQKLALGIMLCLSFFMMIIAIIRTALAPLPDNKVIDTSWLIFWEGIEATTAIIMVSLTAFRSLFGQERMRRRERERRKRKSEKRESGRRENGRSEWWKGTGSGEGYKIVGSAAEKEVVEVAVVKGAETEVVLVAAPEAAVVKGVELEGD